MLGQQAYRLTLNHISSSTKLSCSISTTDSSSPIISWYPGHIAKAERALADYLKKVDVVIEVRDARIPFSTTHPMVPKWVGNKPIIIAMVRIDQISKKALKNWKEYYTINPPYKDRPDVRIFFVDGKLGSGVFTLRKQCLKAVDEINEKRLRKGMQPRAVRAAVIGFPNVGKSALINRILGRKLAKSRNLPGVTRSLNWIRIGGKKEEQINPNDIELLDSPGIIPARQFDQYSALRLAICNDIGEASYDRVVVAAAMCDQINELHKTHPGFVNMNKINERYKMNFDALTGEEIVYAVAQKHYTGNTVSAADKLLGDFRKGYLGYSSLEAPLVTQKSMKEKKDHDMKEDGMESNRSKTRKLLIQREKVVDDPTDESIQSTNDENTLESTHPRTVKDKEVIFNTSEIGKGAFEGW